MGEDKRGSEDGAGYMRVTESCSLLLEAELSPWCEMGSEQCVAP